MPSRHNGWPVLIGSDSINVTPAWTQSLADTLAATVGQGTTPPDEIVDTGWLDCTLDQNRGHRPGYFPQARRIGKVVYFRGHMNNNGLTKGTPRLFTLPNGLQPTMETRWIGFRTTEAATPFGGWFSPSDRGCYMQIPESPPGGHFCILVSPWLVD